MKYIFHLIAVVLMAAAFQINFPWWSVAVAGMLVGTFGKLKPGMAFLIGAAGGFLLWGGMAAWYDFQNEHILSERLAMLVFKNQHGWLMVLLTGFVGGLTAGLGMLSGALGKSAMNYKSEN